MSQTEERKPAREITIREKAQIKWENRLIEGSYSLSLMEMRMIIALSAHIDKNAASFTRQSVSATELGHYMGLDDTNAMYDVIRKTASSLLDRSVAFEWQEEGAKRKSWLYVHWLEAIGYDAKTHSVYWHFSETMAPVLLKVKEAYTKIEAKKLIRFKSQYSSRLFLLLTVWEHTGEKIGAAREKEIYIADLREQFNLGDLYPAVGDLLRRVITPAVEEINALTEFDVKATPIRSGRAYHFIRFNIRKKSEKKRANLPAPVVVPSLPSNSPSTSSIRDYSHPAGKMSPETKAGLAALHEKMRKAKEAADKKIRGEK